MLYDGTSDRGGCACAAAGNGPAPGRSVADTARGYADTPAFPRFDEAIRYR
ncbi:predicted protein [Streptomyces pristinaespiralis ATCC 25486]|uniref:Predicted protein n=1 Tax=Streptomyces pristinaespiralis (strain ATCC 25486 / DSM 40338 / CBS 914.69 / JCM 4507 / KCC S-0507 / NBRC 13074 / NRRL 2958 / 5647) TaxID=457429 RepID=D6X6W1_STRE2|nr:predicted protein [Streptomyces pristinaespiralis ATCC 25486]